MKDFISIETLIKQAKKEGIDFGKGDPYNRLRYYTKIGWLPHMTRQSDKKGNVIGHYPRWALERLILIEDLKKKDVSNDEITKRVQVQNKIQNFTSVIKSKETRKQIVSYATLILLVIILANETGIIGLNSGSKSIINDQASDIPNQIIDSGTAFIPRNQKVIFVKNPIVRQNSRVFITFTQDFSPAVRYWVENIKPYEGFEVNLDAPSFENAEFTWWISN